MDRLVFVSLRHCELCGSWIKDADQLGDSGIRDLIYLNLLEEAQRPYV